MAEAPLMYPTASVGVMGAEELAGAAGPDGPTDTRRGAR